MQSDATDIVLREIQADDASHAVGFGGFGSKLKVNHKPRWSFNDPWGELWLLYQQIVKGYHGEKKVNALHVFLAGQRKQYWMYNITY